MAKTLDEARKKLDDEYGQVRRHLQKIHDALDKVEKAGPEDDLHGLLVPDGDLTTSSTVTGWRISSRPTSHGAKAGSTAFQPGLRRVPGAESAQPFRYGERRVT